MKSSLFAAVRRAFLKPRLMKATKTGLMALGLAGLMTLSAFSQPTRNWTGANSPNWSDPNNWSPAGLPQIGEFLQFGVVDDSHDTMVNDLANVSVAGLDFY